MKGLVAELKKIEPPTAKKVLKELSKRIHQGDFRSDGFVPRRVFVETQALVFDFY